jgi:glycosyltransferase involved in cell wall biosynthesis
MLLYIRGRQEYLPTAPPVRRRLATFVLGRADRVLVQSDTIRGELLRSRQAARPLALRLAGRIRVIPNGVEQRRPRETAGGYVLYVGRLVGLKGVDVLLDAMRRLPGVELVLVGDGPERDRLQKLGAGLPATFVGHVPHDEALRYIENARCLVLPSRTEASSNVILEAMSLGVPVVATRVGGNPDMVRSGENGFLVPPDDAEALGDAIGSIVRSDEVCHALGSRGHVMASQYTWEAAARLLEDEIRVTASDSRGTSHESGATIRRDAP